MYAGVRGIRAMRGAGTMRDMSCAPSPMSATGPVTSPCVRRCTLDQDDVCVGCGRTLDEIRQWGVMTQAQREACVASAARRREARDAAWAAPPAQGAGRIGG